MGLVPSEFKGKLGANELAILNRMSVSFRNRNLLQALKELKENNSITSEEYEKALRKILVSEGLKLEEETG